MRRQGHLRTVFMGDGCPEVPEGLVFSPIVGRRCSPRRRLLTPTSVTPSEEAAAAPPAVAAAVSNNNSFAQKVSKRSGSTIQINTFFGRGPKSVETIVQESVGSGANAGASVDGEDGEDDMPTLAAMERDRVGKRKLPCGPRGRTTAVRKTKQTCISVEQRLREFPDESFKKSAGQLFCQACKEVMPNLKEQLKRHCLSAKHSNRLQKFNSVSHDELSLQTDLANYFLEHPDEKSVCSHHFNKRR